MERDNVVEIGSDIAEVISWEYIEQKARVGPRNLSAVVEDRFVQTTIETVITVKKDYKKSPKKKQQQKNNKQNKKQKNKKQPGNPVVLILCV